MLFYIIKNRMMIGMFLRVKKQLMAKLDKLDN